MGVGEKTISMLVEGRRRWRAVVVFFCVVLCAAVCRGGDWLLVDAAGATVAEYHIVLDELQDDAGAVVGTRTLGAWSIGATPVPSSLERGRSGQFTLSGDLVELVAVDEAMREAWMRRVCALVGLGAGLGAWAWYWAGVRQRSVTFH